MERIVKTLTSVLFREGVLPVSVEKMRTASTNRVVIYASVRLDTDMRKITDVWTKTSVSRVITVVMTTLHVTTQMVAMCVFVVRDSQAMAFTANLLADMRVKTEVNVWRATNAYVAMVSRAPPVNMT